MSQDPHSAAIRDDLGFDASELSAGEVIAFLDRRVQEVLGEFQSSPLWSSVSAPATEPALILALMKEICLDIVMYQPYVAEATHAMIAQMPRELDADVFEMMMRHQIDEFSQGQRAMRDYVGLGGSEAEALRRRMSPTAFSTAAVWRMLAELRDPFAYLGAYYPFESLTPIAAGMMKGVLQNKAIAEHSTEFVVHHATADLEHQKLLKDIIAQVVDAYPSSKASICYGLEYFLAVYPMPVWNAAFRRAQGQLASRA